MELTLGAKSWNDITVEFFFMLKAIEEDLNLSAIQKQVKTLSYLSGQPEVEILKLKDISEYFEKELAFLRTEVGKGDLKEFYYINDKKYKLIRQINDLTAGQFIDLQTYVKNGDNTLDNLHLILTVFLIPVKDLTPKEVINNKVHSLLSRIKSGKRLIKSLKWKYKEGIPENYMKTPVAVTSEELYQHMKITDAMSIMVFFCLLWECFAITMETYLEETKRKQLAKVSQTLNSLPQTEEVNKIKSKIHSLQNGAGLSA